MHGLFCIRRLGIASYYCSWKPMEWIATRAFCSNVSVTSPKLPLKPFVKFAEEKRAEIKEQQLKQSGLTAYSQAAKLWNELPSEDKMVYDSAFAKEMLVYKSLREQWWNNLPEEQKSTFLSDMKCKTKKRTLRKFKKQMRQLGRPQKPAGAFLLFATQQKNSSNGITNGKESFQNNLHLWRSMSVEEKQPYFDKSKETYKVYRIQHGVWELQMMKNGHGDLLRKAKKLWEH